jgi:hypothetical protein
MSIESFVEYDRGFKRENMLIDRRVVAKDCLDKLSLCKVEFRVRYISTGYFKFLSPRLKTVFNEPLVEFFSRQLT